MKASRRSAAKQEFKLISRGEHHWKSFSSPKDKDNISAKVGVIYRYRCDHCKCIGEYIGETRRT